VTLPSKNAGPSAAPIFLRRAALDALDDRVVVRDPAGRGAFPHLVPTTVAGERALLARGSFLIRLRYAVPKAEGVAFCRATGDDNPIHSVGDVVPGAYTAAKVLLPIEVLFPALEIAQTSIRFTSIALYDRPIFTVFRCEPTAEGAAFHAVTSQEGRPVAEVMAYARRVAPAPSAEVARRKVNVERLRAVRSFIRSLHVAPHAYFRHAARVGYFYPKSFLASLPSGAMVRTLRGEGGLLNKLSLEFEGERVAITGREDPAVQIEQPKARRSFNKILAAIGDGIRTYVRGSALVSTGEVAASAASRLLAGGAGGLVAEPTR
jgi:hypothetical protein